MVKTYKRRKHNTKKQMKSGKNNSKHTLRKMKSKSKSRVTKRRQRGGMNRRADESKPLLGSIRRIPDMKRSDEILKDSQLITYASSGKLDGVEEEVKKMKNPGDINEEINYITALMAASQYGHNDVVQYLLEKDADPNIETSSIYRNALTIAASHKELDVMKTLLTFHYADANKIMVDKGNMTDVTPLMITVLNNDGTKKFYDIIKLLLEKGADVNATDKRKKTALERAVRNGNGPVVTLLLNHGAKHTFKDGTTAYDLATLRKKQDAIAAIAGFMHMKPGAYWGNSNSKGTIRLLGDEYPSGNGHNLRAAATPPYEPPKLPENKG